LNDSRLRNGLSKSKSDKSSQTDEGGDEDVEGMNGGRTNAKFS
jgi:hypothetical protein